MRKHDLVSSFVFICFGLFVVLYSPHLDVGSLRRPGSGFMPFLCGLIICGFAAATFLRAFFNRSNEIEKIWDKVNFLKLILVILPLILYIFLLNLLGFIISSFFMVLIIMRYAGSQTWIKSVSMACVSSISLYLFFGMWLKIQLPKGILGFIE